MIKVGFKKENHVPGLYFDPARFGLRKLYVRPSFRRIQVFSSYQSVLRHIRKHMLDPDQSSRWLQVVPELKGILGEESIAEDLKRISKQIRKDKKLLQKLYRCYSSAIERALDDAREHGWLSAEGSNAVAVGTSGLLVVLREGVIRTAFFPSGSASGSLPRSKGRGMRTTFRHCFLPTLRHIRSADRAGRLLRNSNAKWTRHFRSLSKAMPAGNFTLQQWLEMKESWTCLTAA